MASEGFLLEEARSFEMTLEGGRSPGRLGFGLDLQLHALTGVRDGLEESRVDLGIFLKMEGLTDV